MNLSQLKRDELINTLEFLKNNVTENEIRYKIDEIKIELNKKKYGIVWEEHEEKVDKELRTKIPVFKEDKELEITKNNEKPINFLIEGDNLHSLYLLEKTHKEKIDVIYIDPPYNTLKKDEFIYDDKCVDENDNFKHSKWLSFMNRRLKIAKNLLKEDGIICISIDENESSTLKLLCDEIFGENNRLSTHHIKVRYENKSLNEDNDWQPVMEYVYIYAKNKMKFSANKPSEEYDLSKFQYKITELTKGEEIEIGNKKVTIFKEGEWKIEKQEGRIGLLKETWASGSIVRQSGTAAEFLSKYLIQRKEIDGLNCLYKIDNMGEDGLGHRYVTGPKKADAIRGKFYSGVPLERINELNENGTSRKTRPITNYYDLSGDFGNIRNEGGVPFNNGKKPVKMIKELINYHKNKNAVILDFFAGSGSTGQAVLELNQEDGGNRRFILGTNNENNICKAITYKRLKNVIEGYGKNKPLLSNLKYFRTEYIDKYELPEDELETSDKLMENIEELIMLENNVFLNNNEIKIAYEEEDIENIIKNIEKTKKIYMSSDILLEYEQEDLFNSNNIQVVEIPEHYYRREIEE